MKNRSRKITLKQNAQKQLTLFREKYKSSNDYYPRAKIPVNKSQDIEKLIAEENQVPMIKAFLAYLTSEAVYEFLTNIILAQASEKEPFHRLAHETAVVEICKHGQCGPLATALLVDLLESQIAPQINFCSIHQKNKENGLEVTHAFLVAKKDKQSIVLDPYFNICCPLSEYYSHQQLVEYFSVLTKDPEWSSKNIKGNDIKTLPYITRECLERLPVVKKQIEMLSDLAVKEDPITFKKIALQLEYIEALDEKNFHLQVALGKIKSALKIVKTLQGNDKKEAKKTLTPHFVFFKSPHVALMKTLEAIVETRTYIRPFIERIENKEYERALRMASNDKIIGYKLVSLLLNYKNDLGMDINARAGESQFSALDYAKNNPDKRIYEILIAHGATSTKLLSDTVLKK